MQRTIMKKMKNIWMEWTVWTAWTVWMVKVKKKTVALIGAAVLGNTVQQGLMFTPSKLEPKLSKLNPVEGVKRMFGPQGWVNFFKGIGKMGLVSIAIAVVLWPRRGELAALPGMELVGVLSLLRTDAILLMLAALAVYTLIAAGDFFFQRHELPYSYPR